MKQRPKLIRRRNFLLGLGTLATASAVATVTATSQHQQIKAIEIAKRDFTVTDGLSLNKRAARKGLIYGVASRQRDLASDALYAAAVVQNCSMLVPEWEFKWNASIPALRPSPDNFDFTAADWMANFAATHNLLLRGHTLVWHDSLPKWFQKTVTKQNARQLLESHIQTVVKRYAGKIHSWDVVNEAIEVSDGRSDGLRYTPWLQFVGADYIEIAFRAAAAADPKALLVYNDYGLDYDTSEDEAKRTAVLKLLEALKSKGVPIHALGIQAHLSGEESRFNPEKFRKFLSKVASLGLKILITEMDVTDNKLPLDINGRDRIVAGAYEDYLSAALDERAVIAVITWGLSDRYSWLSEFAPRPDKAPIRAMPLDAKMQRKLAWNAIARAFDHAPKR